MTLWWWLKQVWISIRYPQDNDIWVYWSGNLSQEQDGPCVNGIIGTWIERKFDQGILFNNSERLGGKSFRHVLEQFGRKTCSGKKMKSNEMKS